MIKKNKLKTLVRSRDGIALAVVVIITAAVSILGFAILATTSSEVHQTIRHEQQSQAYYLADSIVMIAQRDIQTRLYGNIEYNDLLAKARDGTITLFEAYDLSDLADEIGLDTVPDTDGAVKTVDVYINDGEFAATAPYPVTITRRDSAVPGVYDLIVQCRVNGAVSAASTIRIGSVKTELLDLSLPDPFAPPETAAIRSTGNVTIEYGNGHFEGDIINNGNLTIGNTEVKGNVKTAGNLNKGNPNARIVGDAEAGGLIQQKGTGWITGAETEGALIDDFVVNAEIITPEMVWNETIYGGNALPDARKNLTSSTLPGTITSTHSGYYPGLVPSGNKTINLATGSVVLIFDRYNGATQFTITNTNPATMDDHFFYLFIRESYQSGGAGVYDQFDYDPDSTSGMKVRNSGELTNIDGNSQKFLNASTLGTGSSSKIRAFLIVYNEAAQKYIYDHNQPDRISPPSRDDEDYEDLWPVWDCYGRDSTGADGAFDEFYQWPLDKPLPGTNIVRYNAPAPEDYIANPGAHPLYFDNIIFEGIGGGGSEYVHIIAPFCRVDIPTNNGNLYGSVRAANYHAGNKLDLHQKSIDSPSIAGALFDPDAPPGATIPVSFNIYDHSYVEPVRIR